MARLETRPIPGSPGRFEFTLVSLSNLHDKTAPHMRRVVFTLIDRDHFNETWTKTEKGVDAVFDLSFTRRAPQP